MSTLIVTRSKRRGVRKMRAVWPVIKEEFPALTHFTKLLKRHVGKKILKREKIRRIAIDLSPGEMPIQQRVTWPEED